MAKSGAHSLQRCFKTCFGPEGYRAESVIMMGEVRVPLAEAIELLLKRPRRASPEVRAEQGGTQAETPQAISRAAAQNRNAADK